MMTTKKQPTMLMILDGYGLNDSQYGNAVAAAETPNLDRIFHTYPNIRLNAGGLAVGLPEGQMGNSEVGHLNIGAGRIIYQELTKITKSIGDGDFFENPALNKAMDHALSNNSALHIFGLLSDGGVHSHIEHIKALILMAKKRSISKLYLHCFMDGRDVPPTSGIDYMTELEDFMAQEALGKVATVSGRYYAMDRDKRWERVELAYDAMTSGKGFSASSGSEAVELAYSREETDEFIKPTVCAHEGMILDGDSIIFANFRPDRAREITRAFVDESFEAAGGFPRKVKIKDLSYVCMTQYDKEMPWVEVAFPPQTINNTLGEYISSLGLSQLRIAETEKYAHVTFFFNGGVEAPNPLEERILVPSPKVATYDLQPEMSAYPVTEKVLEALDGGKHDLIILNFANADMVGHTGVFEAAVAAVEALDVCVEKIVEKTLSIGGRILLTADHGNADTMLTDEGQVMTAHSTNPVPLVEISENPLDFNAYAKSGEGKLADIAPTLLTLMKLPIPEEMTGKSLV